MEQWPDDGGKYGKFSDHLYGNGNEQWLYEHCPINGNVNENEGANSRSDTVVGGRRRRNTLTACGGGTLGWRHDPGA